MTVTTAPAASPAFALRAYWRTLNRVPLLPILLLAPMIVWGLFGPWLWPHDPTAVDLMAPLKPPAWIDGGTMTHLLGTDQFGRDLFSRLIEGARVSLIVVGVGVLGSAAIGIYLGLVAGYYGGVVDNVLMRIVDVMMSIPSIMLMILIGGALGGGVMTISILIIVVFWSNFARVVRAETLVIRESNFVALAKVANCSNFRILRRHILPNLLATCVVLITLQFGRALIIEASITFIGVGIQPPDSAWGLLISDGRAYMSSAWWICTFAGLAITITVLGGNLLGDWLRDVLDPRSRRI